jgi:hypothetical protein
MRAALIPPKGYFDTALLSDYHLILAQIKDPLYIATYVNDGTDDDFLILDNGAAEGGSVSDEELLRVAALYGVDEVVVPDVIGDFRETIERCKGFMSTYGVHVETGDSIGFMGVLQSNGAKGDWLACIDEYSKHASIKTLGIPRHFVDKDPYMRLMVCEYIKQNDLGERFEVHLLGTNAKFPAEIKMLAKEHDWIRGVDSSMPYNYTMDGKQLKHMRPGVTRPENYFEHYHVPMQQNLLTKNINTYLRWANDPESPWS